MKHLYAVTILGVFFLASCGFPFQPWEGEPGDAAEAREIAEGASMAARYEADLEAEREAAATAYALEAMIETVIAEDQAHLAQLTREAELQATATAEFFATIDAGYEVAETAMAIRTEDALTRQRGCPGGCTTYPTWCDPAIKGNVSFNNGERIYHMQGDEYYEETRIDPDYGEYYFCTPDEAEAAGFRRAFN